MTDQEIRRYIEEVVTGKFSEQQEIRTEAVKEVLNLAIGDIDEKALENFAAFVPAIPLTIYQKWAEMFSAKLLETVQKNQLLELCKDTEENRATLALVYIMFMESERMEKVVSSDLQKLGMELANPEDCATMLGTWLKTRISRTYQ